MLKLNYTDDGLFLEQVTASLDAVAIQRVMLAVHVGEPLHLVPTRATVLLSVEMPGINHLESVLEINAADTITLANIDEKFVEVSLKGTWIAKDADAESGTFITALTPESERLIYWLWQVTQRQAAYFM
ncbi:MAG: alr0857 family protein [Cyanobacteria bacterium P01_B01_bin.77]